MPSYVWDEITYPFTNFKHCSAVWYSTAMLEVWEWISTFIPHLTGHVISYPCYSIKNSPLTHPRMGCVQLGLGILQTIRQIWGRGLIAVTDLVNLRLFGLHDYEMGWMTLKNNSAPLLCLQKLCVSCHSNVWIATGFILRRCTNRIKISHISASVTLKFDIWLKKTTGNLFHIGPTLTK